MKKRKNLLGLALAATAVFSLSACGEETPTDPTPAVTPDGGGDEVTEKFDVKFMNGATELTALKQTVDKDQKATKPAKASLPTQTGKRFDYWSADGGVTAYNFDEPVTDAVTLTAVFADENEYDTLAASNAKIFASDFYDQAVETTTAAEVSYDSNAIKVSTNSADNKISNDNKYHIEKNELGIDFGDKKISTTGILTVYFEVSFDAIKNGEAFFQVNGTSGEKTNSEVFGLRVMGGTDNSTKGRFAYRLDQGSDVVTATNPKPEAGTVYNFKIELDTAEGKATITVDDDVMAEVNNINISAIRGIKFTAKPDGSSKKNVDNVVATFTSKTADPVVSAKAQAQAAINEYKAGTEYTGLSAALKAYVDKAIAGFASNISSATTVDAVNDVKTSFNQFVSYDKYTVPVKAYTAASTPETTVADQYICVVDTYTTSSDITTQFGAIKFSGYNVNGIYSDATLTNTASATDVVKNATLYASVAAVSASSETVTFEALEAKAYGDKTTFGSYISLVGSGDWTVDSNNKKYLDLTGTSVSLTKRLKSGGARNNMLLDLSAFTGKTVSLEIYAATGSAGATRNVIIKNEAKDTTLFTLASRDTGETAAAGLEKYDGTNPLVFTLTGGAKYYITTDAGINFHAINIKVAA